MSKTRNLVLTALTLAAITTTGTAFAQSTAICTDSLQRICKETVLQRAERNKYVKVLKEDIAIEAEKNATQELSR